MKLKNLVEVEIVATQDTTLDPDEESYFDITNPSPWISIGKYKFTKSKRYDNDEQFLFRLYDGTDLVVNMIATIRHDDIKKIVIHRFFVLEKYQNKELQI
jgi:hypothetical protein